MEISPNFKMVFLSLTGITFTCLLIMMLFAIWGTPEAELSKTSCFQQQLILMCNFGWQAGFGALLGLIGGKAIS